MRAHHVVLFFDNLHLKPGNRNWIIKRLDDFLDSVFDGPSTKGMIVSFDRSLKTIKNFTSDAERLKESIERVSRNSTHGLGRAKQAQQVRRLINESVRKENQQPRSQR